MRVHWDQTTFNFLAYNFQLPHGCHGHVGHVGHVGHGGRGEHGGQDRTGQEQTKLTFELDFPGNL